MFETKMRVCMFFPLLKIPTIRSFIHASVFPFFLFPSYLNSGITGKKKLKCVLNFECSFIIIIIIIILCFIFFFFLLFRFSVSNSVIQYSYIIVIYCQEVSLFFFFG